MLEFLKPAHVSLAAASVSGFALRGYWMLRASPLLEKRWVRRVPHFVDTLLLASGLSLAWVLRASPLEQPWLAAKLGAIVLYIIAGSVALRRGKSPWTRAAALAVALLAVAYVIGVAVYRDPSFGI